jgi:hypothetical protein
MNDIITFDGKPFIDIEIETGIIIIKKTIIQFVIPVACIGINIGMVIIDFRIHIFLEPDGGHLKVKDIYTSITISQLENMKELVSAGYPKPLQSIGIKYG